MLLYYNYIMKLVVKYWQPCHSSCGSERDSACDVIQSGQCNFQVQSMSVSITLSLKIFFNIYVHSELQIIMIHDAVELDPSSRMRISTPSGCDE